MKKYTLNGQLDGKYYCLMNIKKILPFGMNLWLFVFSCLPAILLFGLSFMSSDIKLVASFPLTLNHYIELLNPLFLKIAWRSFYISGFATFICFVLAYPFCYFLLKLKNKTIIMILIIIPFWTSSLIRTFAMVDLLKYHGMINKVLLYLHITHTPLQLIYSNLAVFLGLVYNLLPFMILPILNAMETIDMKCIEAAKDLGANKWQIFSKIFWPQSQSGVFNGCIMVFLPAMTLFYIPNILGGSKSILIGNLIQNQFLFLNNWPQGAATSSVLTLVLIIIFWFTQNKGLKR